MKRIVWLSVFLLGTAGALETAQAALNSECQEPAPEGQEPPAAAAAPQEPRQEEPDESTEGAAPAQEEAPAEDRITFEIPFADDVGGGSATGSAGQLRFQEDRVLLMGGVDVLYQDLRFQAEQAEVDQENKIVTATGNVIVDQGPRRLAGETLTWDLESQTGRLTEGSGYVSSDYFFRGSAIEKTGEDTYIVTDGEFTSCDQAVPDWSFSLSKATVTVEGYAKTRNATLRFKRVPVFRLPYVVWPVRAERTSGLLIPKPGFSSRRGASLGLAYYQVLGRSYDTTFQADLFSNNDFLGLGNEFRYHPSEGTRGSFQGYWIRDAEDRIDRAPGTPESRWRIRYDHESNRLPLGLRAVVSLEDVSDFAFFRDFERRANQISQRQLYSKGFVTGNWGPHSLNFLFDRRETFLQQRDAVILRQLPEVEYKLRSTRLGRTPFYLQLRSGLHYLDVQRSPQLTNTYGRADFFPQFTLPLRAASWLSMSVTLGGRMTWYEDSLSTPQERGPVQPDSNFRGQSLTRTVSTASAEIVGPSFSRIYNGKGKKFSKFKHVVEPRWTYNFLDEFDEQERVPLFDEIDNLRGRNVGRFSLVNRVLAKPPEEKGGGAQEILSLELFQDYSFDLPLQTGPGEEPLQEGPIGTLLRYNPSRKTSLKTELRYNTLFGEVVSTAVSGSFGFGANNLGLPWSTRRQAATGDTQTHQTRLTARLALVPNKLVVDAVVNYDIQRRMALVQRYIANYNAHCYSLRLEYGDFRGGGRRDREYRFSMTLRNVGTFLEITGGETETL